MVKKYTGGLPVIAQTSVTAVNGACLLCKGEAHVMWCTTFVFVAIVLLEVIHV